MAFSILSKGLLENYDSIRRIVDGVTEHYESIFTYNQAKKFISNSLIFGIDTRLELKDYDSTSNKSPIYCIGLQDNEQGKFDYADHYCNYYVLPIIRYDEIKGSSKIISEDDDTYTIQYGRGLTSRVSTDDDLRKIERTSMMGDIIETNRKITIFLSKDGEKTQLRVFKNQETEEEYVFMKKKDDESFDDSFDVDATFVGNVSPITWTVDKETGMAICSKPLFLSKESMCKYEQSALSQFLESDEFAEELGVHQEKKQEKRSGFNSPFGEKREELSTEQKIKRILMGKHRIPYLVGHPGIGKTQIAKSINKNCLSFNLATFDPDTFKGKSSIIPGDKIITQQGDKTIEHHEKGRIATAEPEWHTKLVEMSNNCRQSDERCVLLLDEFDKLEQEMQVFINGIVDEPRTIAGWEIPNNVDIILAGNTEEYSLVAYDISDEVASRLTRVEIKPDSIDWLKWASKHDIDPIVRAYLHNFPNKIIQDVKDKDGEYDYSKSLTPRSWDQKISEELKISRKIRTKPYLEPHMDTKSREEFEEFMDMYIYELGVEEILKGNISTDPIHLTTGDDRTQMTINCLTAAATTEEEVTNVLAFISQAVLPQKQQEFQSLFKKSWTRINNTDDDVLTLRCAENNLAERRAEHGKQK